MLLCLENLEMYLKYSRFPLVSEIHDILINYFFFLYLFIHTFQEEGIEQNCGRRPLRYWVLHTTHEHIRIKIMQGHEIFGRTQKYVEDCAGNQFTFLKTSWRETMYLPPDGLVPTTAIHLCRLIVPHDITPQQVTPKQRCCKVKQPVLEQQWWKILTTMKL